MSTTSVWCLTDQMWVTQGSCIFYISTIFIIEAIADNVKTPQIYLSACQFMGKNSHAAFWIPPTPHVSHLMSSTPNTLCMHCTYFNCFVLWYHLYKYTTIFLFRDGGGGVPLKPVLKTIIFGQIHSTIGGHFSRVAQWDICEISPFWDICEISPFGRIARLVSKIAPNMMRGVNVYSEKLHHSVKGDKEPSAGIMDTIYEG